MYDSFYHYRRVGKVVIIRIVLTVSQIVLESLFYNHFLYSDGYSGTQIGKKSWNIESNCY